MNVCMNIAVALPASDITFTIQRLDATGEVVFFGGTLFLKSTFKLNQVGSQLNFVPLCISKYATRIIDITL